jgi:hypothetical protein
LARDARSPRELLKRDLEPLALQGAQRLLGARDRTVMSGRRRWPSCSPGIGHLRRLEPIDDPHEVQPHRLFMSTSRWRPSARARLMSCSVRFSWSRCWGRELVGRQKALAGQASVRVRSGLLQRQPAIAVGEGLPGTRQVLRRPLASDIAVPAVSGTSWRWAHRALTCAEALRRTATVS